MATGVTSFFVGEIKPHVGNTAPDGWLLCDGATYARGTSETDIYWDLWQSLSGGVGTSPWGNGNGTTTFNVPNLRGKTLVGAASPAEVGTTGGAENVTLVAANLPSHTHTLTVDNAGSHTHTGSTNLVSVFHTHNWQAGYTLTGELANAGGYGGFLLANSTGSSGILPLTSGSQTFFHTHTFVTATEHAHPHTITELTTVASGYFALPWDGGAHNNMPPYLVVNFIVKY